MYILNSNCACSADVQNLPFGYWMETLLISWRIRKVHTLISRSNYTTRNHWCFITLLVELCYYSETDPEFMTWPRANVSSVGEGSSNQQNWILLKRYDTEDVGENKSKVKFQVFVLWVLSTTPAGEPEGPLFFQQCLSGICHNGPLKQQDDGKKKRQRTNIPPSQNKYSEGHEENFSKYTCNHFQTQTLLEQRARLQDRCFKRSILNLYNSCTTDSCLAFPCVLSSWFIFIFN